VRALFSWWPFVLMRKDEVRFLKLENATLRDDMRNAVIEIRKHRMLLAQLGTGNPEVTRAMERARP
jgi:hypothetical protein